MEKIENKSKSLLKGNVTKILLGSMIAFIISMVLLLIISAILTYTNISESIIKLYQKE